MSQPTTSNPTVYRILFAISLVHLFNDSIQSVIQAILPILKDSMGLNFTQLGFILFTLSFTASILQPLIGSYSDRKPSPYLLPLGMVSTFLGMFSLAFASNYIFIILSVMLVGIGSAVFHPEGSRVAYMASGARRGLAQSIFQVGGNAGQALAPIITILIFIPLGQQGALWFMLIAAAAFFVQLYIAKWYTAYLKIQILTSKASITKVWTPVRRKKIRSAIILLIFLVFARSWFGACISSFYIFYIMDRFTLSLASAQYYIFGFMAAGAVGTFLGGPIADRIGRRNTIFCSMLGTAPFALILPYVDGFWTFVILMIIGFVLLSSFSVTVVYAQELIPGKIGTVSGLIMGLAFGMGAIGAVAIGGLIDWMGLSPIIKLCSFLPLLGMLTIMLPTDRKLKEWADES